MGLPPGPVPGEARNQPWQTPVSYTHLSADIDGDDIRRKLTISANIAFDALLREEDIPAFGIRTCLLYTSRCV